LLKLAVIADDLTGAADTGIQFRRVFQTVHLVPDQGLEGPGSSPGTEAVSVFTDSRAIEPAQAAAKVGRLARRLAAFKPELVYKKIDSCLRGNIGPEADAIIEALGLEMSLIAPALPRQGRTTVGGIHLVQGRPVAETEVGRDPVSPVAESRLRELIASQSPLPTAHLSLDLLRSGPGPLAEAVGRLRQQGFRHLTCDARTQADLDLVAGLALDDFPKALLVGSAGLAESVGRRLAGPEAAVPDPLAAPISLAPRGSHLLVCGSASLRAKEQVGALAAGGGYEVYTFPAEVLARLEGSPELQELAGRPAGDLAGRGVVLKILRPGEGGPGAVREVPPDRVVAGLARLAAGVMALRRPASLYLSGGDTATAVLAELKAAGLRLEAEVRPGLVVGTVLGGAFDGLPAACKPGSFGGPEYLLDLDRYWSKMTKER